MSTASEQTPQASGVPGPAADPPVFVAAVGIRGADGRIEWVFAADDAAPSVRRRLVCRSDTALTAGSAEALRFAIVAGDAEGPGDVRASAVVLGSSLSADLPGGSRVVLGLRLDDDRALTVSAYIPDTGDVIDDVLSVDGVLSADGGDEGVGGADEGAGVPSPHSLEPAGGPSSAASVGGVSAQASAESAVAAGASAAAAPPVPAAAAPPAPEAAVPAAAASPAPEAAVPQAATPPAPEPPAPAATPPVAVVPLALLEPPAAPADDAGDPQAHPPVISLDDADIEMAWGTDASRAAHASGRHAEGALDLHWDAPGETERSDEAPVGRPVPQSGLPGASRVPFPSAEDDADGQFLDLEWD